MGNIFLKKGGYIPTIPNEVMFSKSLKKEKISKVA